MLLPGLIGIVADDLTGANDTSLQFHLRGANTQILLDYELEPKNAQNTQVWAVSTETRNKQADVGCERVKAATESLLNNISPDYYYKKIDSTLRGNIAIETLTMTETLGYDAAVIIPAFPSEGRVTVGGYHLMRGVPLERTEVACDPLCPIYESHVPTLFRTQLGENFQNLVGELELKTVMKGAGPILMRFRELIGEGKKLIVADSVSTTDIEQIVLAINKSDYKILTAGTAACAQVIGNVWLPEMKNQHIIKKIPQLPKLLISGSATRVTAKQLKQLEQSDEFENTYFYTPTFKEILDGVSEDLVARICENLGADNIVAVHTSHLIDEFDGFSDVSLDAELTREKLAMLITDFLSDLTKRVIFQKEVILITLGGDTSYKCCSAINALQLQLVDEVAPAIALTIDYKAQWIVTKSGNLGNTNTLIEILKYFETHK